MNPFKIKLKQFLPPYLLILFSLPVCYTFLHWLFMIHLDVVRLSDEAVEFYIPALLPWAPLIIWMRPRLKRLNYNTSVRKDPVFALIMFSGIIMSVSLIIAQQYLVTATGKLTRLNYISEIRHTGRTKYYTVQHYYIAKKLAHFYTFYSVSGKHSENFNINLYCAVPVFDYVFPDTSMIGKLRVKLAPQGLVIINGKLQTMAYLRRLPADSIEAMRYLNPSIIMQQYGSKGRYGALAVVTTGYKFSDSLREAPVRPIAWLAFKFSKTINNNKSYSEKNRLMDEHYKYQRAAFMHSSYDNFTYLDRIPNDEQKHYLAAIRYGNNVDDASPTILYPVFDSYENKNGDKLKWLLVINAIGFLFLMLMLRFIPANPGPDLTGEYADA